MLEPKVLVLDLSLNKRVQSLVVVNSLANFRFVLFIVHVDSDWVFAQSTRVEEAIAL